MSQALERDTCEHCKQIIQKGQPVVALLKAAFHSSCLILWCEKNLKGELCNTNLVRPTL